MWNDTVIIGNIKHAKTVKREIIVRKTKLELRSKRSHLHFSFFVNHRLSNILVVIDST